MPLEKTDIIERFTFTGDFSMQGILLLGAVFALVILYLFWRENQSGKKWFTLLLAGLRLAAVAVILWMLAGPTMETTLRHSRSKSILFLADTSASMDVAETSGDPGDEIRWKTSLEPAAAASVLSELDGAASGIAALKSEVKRFQSACNDTRRARQAEAIIVLIRRNLKSVASALDKVRSRLPVDFNNARGDLAAAGAALNGPVSAELGRMEEDFRSGRLILAGDKSERFSLLDQSLAQLVTRTTGVADAWAKQSAMVANPAWAGRDFSQLTRIEKMASFLDQSRNTWLRDFRGKVRIGGYRFAETVSPFPSQDWRSAIASRITEETMATDLSAVMEQAARDAVSDSLAAVVLITDGGHNTERDPVKTAAALSQVPFFIIPIGNTEPVRDLILHHVQGPRTAFLKDNIIIEAILDAHGCNGETLNVQLVQDNSVVENQSVTVTSDMYVYRLYFTRKALLLGPQQFEIRVEPVEGERSNDNNSGSAVVDVIEDVLRVLVVDQMPRWEHRYLRNLFKRDEHVQFEELLFEPRQPDGRSPAAGTGFPKDLNSWARYRTVILGDLNPREFTEAQQKMVEEYVNLRGGTLILIAGDNHMPRDYVQRDFDNLIPVQAAMPLPAEQGMTLTVTSEGALLPVTQLDEDALTNSRLWAEQLPLYALSPYSQPKPTSHVLLMATSQTARRPGSDSERAFLCWQSYGRGRVVYLAAPVTYRLRYRHGDEYHHRFWGQLLRWAMARDLAGGSKTIRLATDKSRYQHGDEVQVSARLIRLNGEPVGGAQARVLATQAGNTVAEMVLVEEKNNPGSYQALFKNLPSGTLTLTVDGLEVQELLASEKRTDPVETTFTIDPADRAEIRNTRCNLPLIKQIAEAGGGTLIPPTGLQPVLSQLDLSPEMTEHITQRPLWTRWSCLWVFIGCLTLEWLLRKLNGMA